MFLVRVNEGKTRGVETCPFYIARLDQKGKPQIMPISASKKNVGYFFCSVPSADVDKKFRAKDKAETQMSGTEPGIPSLIQVVQSRTKKLISKPIMHSPFNPAPATSYGAAQEEEK